jgi:hypothetical protein
VTAKNTTMPAINSAVFVSGSNGGLVHGIVISTTDTSFCPGRQSTVVIHTMNGHAQSGPVLGGDSGGPVFKYNVATSDPDDITAVGSLTCSNRIDRASIVPIHIVEAVTDSTVVIGGN